MVRSWELISAQQKDTESFWEGDCDNPIYVSKYYSGCCIENKLFKDKGNKAGRYL